MQYLYISRAMIGKSFHNYVMDDVICTVCLFNLRQYKFDEVDCTESVQFQALFRCCTLCMQTTHLSSNINLKAKQSEIS